MTKSTTATTMTMTMATPRPIRSFDRCFGSCLGDEA
jgi:hypothetical protein